LQSLVRIVKELALRECEVFSVQFSAKKNVLNSLLLNTENGTLETLPKNFPRPFLGVRFFARVR